MKVRFFLALAAVATGCFTGCTTARHNMPPAQRMLEPGPGVGGPGPGVLGQGMPAGGMGGVVTAAAMMPADCNACSGGAVGDDYGAGMGMMMPGANAKVQVLFNRPEGMEIHYDVVGDGGFGSEPLYVPGRLEFPQGGIYRLKLTNIQGREGVELYPTVEVANGNPRTAAYLAHNAIPVQFTVDDFEQVLSGNFVTKVIYLPDPEFQGDALVGVDVLVSNRIDPGLDPIVEADRRGSILGIVRIGNKDIELTGASMDPGYVAMGGMMVGPNGMQGGVPASLPGYVAGVTAPQYGMPISGTPIGLPGPPHIPLGTPAGLKSHVMTNRTHTHLPDPVKNMKINVRQSPGVSYPQPPSRVRIHEQNLHPGYPTGAPLSEYGSQSVTGASGEYCPE
ncbi:hypothetical protein [Aureliella helgolandensis]|uniref:Uncharacterized protein n=1 Tax=Aureliella helgolandensis TaxID=2527968 RepID=A0A518GGH4_9BACT|nr:hypothetical protein [Aureliella helgolandensis]QDV27694.1 hypothetical protein Q31a_60870 [Aureliella helgolandensis]